MSGEESVLVTGVSGFIGTHVAQQLLQLGYRVRGTVRSKSDQRKVEPLMNLCPEARYPLELVEADLTKEQGWREAVTGCTYVIHVASPFPSQNPRDEQEVIGPAVDGTLHVLRACSEARCVKRVVLTSSMAAVHGETPDPNHIYTEDDWTDIDKCTAAYFKSKTLAEKAAWKFVSELPEDQKFELATINPGFVLGPVLCGAVGTSQDIIRALLERDNPVVPKLNTVSVDVRDVAAAHIAAMTLPEASGKRHCIGTVSLWFADIANILRKEFKPQGYNVPTSVAPYWLMWVMGRFNKMIKFMLPLLGNAVQFRNTRMTDILKVQPRPMEESIIEMAYSMIENGSVEKTSMYNVHASAKSTKSGTGRE